MLFHNRKFQEYCTINSLNLNFNGIRLERVENMRLLGLELDERLTFSKHVSHLHQKIIPFIYALRRIRKFISEKTAIILYFAYVQSRLMYVYEQYLECRAEISHRLNGYSSAQAAKNRSTKRQQMQLEGTLLDKDSSCFTGRKLSHGVNCIQNEKQHG